MRLLFNTIKTVARLAVLLMSATMVVPAFSATPSTPTTAPSTSIASNAAHLPFYEARKGDTRIYILGTMHVGRPGEALRQEIAQALTGSSTLVMEISREELSQMAPLTMSYLCLDACLKRQISSENFVKLQQLAGPLGGVGALEHMPAWMVSLVLSGVDYAKAGLMPMAGTEERIVQVWGKRPTVGLETAGEQLNVLASFNDTVQREMLEGYLRLSESKRLELIQKLYQLWQAGDAEAIYNWYLQMDAAEGMSPAVLKATRDQLVVARNRRFVERLLKQPIAAGKPVFLAVGALHLGGSEGVLALLRAQGFSVTAR